MKSSPIRDSVYSFRNADDVVRAFMRKYARVSVNICKMQGVPIEGLRNYLIGLYMYRNARWNRVREILKRLQDADEIDYLYHLSKADRPKYIQMLSSLMEDEWLESGFPE